MGNSLHCNIKSKIKGESTCLYLIHVLQDVGGAEDCVHTTSNGLWSDYSCVAEFNYICGPSKLKL